MKFRNITVVIDKLGNNSFHEERSDRIDDAFAAALKQRGHRPAIAAIDLGR